MLYILSHLPSWFGIIIIVITITIIISKLLRRCRSLGGEKASIRDKLGVSMLVLLCFVLFFFWNMSEDNEKQRVEY